ncbi:cytochrome c [Wenzhouxiangella sp. XN24]|uniref:c-type cytochrome n=1 Tax=Wenzhouxiangella sp. XN24 TaxID=2713569 RepID=UPI0013ED3103|nr:cytochrome c [Wenzhouxiangella sp. XN24]NGX16337.1 c-type cytochrome [Wenzhouxiangella sp. XN24]
MRNLTGTLLAASALLLAAATVAPVTAAPPHPLAARGVTDLSSLQDGERIYAEACAACHGADGAGVRQEQLGFAVPPPDFTDCNFATREAQADWVAVAHDGGPVRAFARFMPAFGKALSEDQLRAVDGHIRTFCRDDAWPRGELNLPLPLYTTKAFPEDEMILQGTVAMEGPGSVALEAIFEKRIGARNQVEVAVPIAWRESVTTTGDGTGDWRSVLGDIVLGYKRVMYASLARGTIVSAAVEVVLPTGDEESGFSSNTVIVEPMLLVGQLFSRGLFMHGQAGLGLSLDAEEADDEAFWRMAAGKMITEGRWGRRWTPMVEVLGSRELVSGADTQWDAVPQVQVTLNRRQHVRLGLGARIPLNNTDERDIEARIYVLWDFFDGGLADGW